MGTGPRACHRVIERQLSRAVTGRKGQSPGANPAYGRQTSTPHPAHTAADTSWRHSEQIYPMPYTPRWARTACAASRPSCTGGRRGRAPRTSAWSWTVALEPAEPARFSLFGECHLGPVTEKIIEGAAQGVAQGAHQDGRPEQLRIGFDDGEHGRLRAQRQQGGGNKTDDENGRQADGRRGNQFQKPDDGGFNHGKGPGGAAGRRPL